MNTYCTTHGKVSTKCRLCMEHDAADIRAERDAARADRDDEIKRRVNAECDRDEARAQLDDLRLLYDMESKRDLADRDRLREALEDLLRAQLWPNGACKMCGLVGGHDHRFACGKSINALLPPLPTFEEIMREPAEALAPAPTTSVQPHKGEIRLLVHEYGKANGLFHCSAPHEMLGVCHDHRCDELTELVFGHVAGIYAALVGPPPSKSSRKGLKIHRWDWATNLGKSPGGYAIRACTSCGIQRGRLDSRTLLWRPLPNGEWLATSLPGCGDPQASAHRST